MKTRFNNFAVAISLGACAALPLPAISGGVPTIDVAAIAQMAQQATADAQHYSAVLQNWEQQIQTAQNQLASMTGVRNVTSMLGDLQRISQSFTNLNRSIGTPENLLNNGFEALEASSRQLMQQYGVGDRCNREFPDNERQKICEGEIIANIILVERKKIASEQLNDIIQRLNLLAQQASSSTDLKSSQDIANQIALAQASLSALQLNFDIIKTDEANFSSAIEERKNQWMIDSSGRGMTFENPFQSNPPSEQW